MRSSTKGKKRIKCAYKKCTKDAIKKALGYYYKGRYFCSRGHKRKAYEENEMRDKNI